MSKKNANNLYFKITNADENHHGYQYVTGLNILDGDFNTNGTCVSGGLYFTKIKYIFKYLSYGVYLREIHLPTDDNFQMVTDPSRYKWRANMIILGKKRVLSNVLTFKYLIENGADIHIDNNCALKWAAGNGYYKIVKLLLEYGADINAQNNCAIKLASENGHSSVVELLIGISNNPFVNSEALVLAAKNGHSDVVKIFIDNGTNLSFNYFEALQLACNYGRKNVVKILLKNNVNPNNVNNYTLWKICLNKRIKIIKILLDYGLSVNACSGNMIKWAAHYGHVKLVNLLLENGANINDSRTICWASKHGHYKVVDLLLSKGIFTKKEYIEAIRWAERSKCLKTAQLIKKKMIELNILNAQ